MSLANNHVSFFCLPFHSCPCLSLLPGIVRSGLRPSWCAPGHYSCSVSPRAFDPPPFFFLLYYVRAGLRPSWYAPVQHTWYALPSFLHSPIIFCSVPFNPPLSRLRLPFSLSESSLPRVWAARRVESTSDYDPKWSSIPSRLPPGCHGWSKVVCPSLSRLVEERLDSLSPLSSSEDRVGPFSKGLLLLFSLLGAFFIPARPPLTSPAHFPGVAIFALRPSSYL